LSFPDGLLGKVLTCTFWRVGEKELAEKGKGGVPSRLKRGGGDLEGGPFLS